MLARTPHNLLFALLLVVAWSSQCFAFTGATPLSSIMAKKVLFRGMTIDKEQDGQHEFHIRLYGQDGALVHEESIKSEVRNGRFDLILGSGRPLMANLLEDLSIGISIDNQKEVTSPTKFAPSAVLNEQIYDAAMVAANRPMPAFGAGEITAQAAERQAIHDGVLWNPVARLMPDFNRGRSPVSGVHLEMSLAAPEIPTMDYYQMAKYGRINVEYNNAFQISGDDLGVAAQAMHVAHHLLLYSAGLTSDINGDGMFLMTFGGAHYQIGNSRAEPFVDAPFVRFKYTSSPQKVFVYSEFETTMHYRSYISGTVGLGLRLTDYLYLVGGMHHTEFVMPTEQAVRMVEGFHGIMNWAL